MGNTEEINDIVEQVFNRKEAERVVAELLLRFSGETAYTRIEKDAEFSKQSNQETARRITSNLFTSLTTVRP